MRKTLFIAVVLFIAGTFLYVFALKTLAPTGGSTNGGADALVTATPLDKPTVSFGNPSRGPKDAKLAMFVFGDYQCESCATFEATVAAVAAAHPADVRVVWKDMPDSRLHPEATNAAVAARCAGEQGAFWAYHDLLMAQKGIILAANYVPFATTLQLDEDSFKGCYDNALTKPMVQRDYDEGQRLRITATPTVFIGSHRLEGAVSADRLNEVIAVELQK